MTIHENEDHSSDKGKLYLTSRTERGKTSALCDQFLSANMCFGPVLDKQGDLAGIIRKNDILSFLFAYLEDRARAIFAVAPTD